MLWQTANEKRGINMEDSIQGHTTALASTLTPAQHMLAEIGCSVTSVTPKSLVPGTVALRHQVTVSRVSSEVPQTPPQAQVPCLFSPIPLLPLASTGSISFPLGFLSQISAPHYLDLFSSARKK